MNFEKKVELGNATLKITVSGFFNEFADLGKHDFATIRNLMMDFSGLELINSRGIMIWVRWFHEALAKNSSLKIIFMNCPRVLVDQFNNIASLLPKGTQVRSFSVPMYCANCDEAKSLTIFEGKDYVFNAATGIYDVTVPMVMCQSCNQPMTPDFNPKKYFSFLKPKG